MTSTWKYIYNKAALPSTQVADKVNPEDIISLNKASAVSNTTLEPMYQL